MQGEHERLVRHEIEGLNADRWWRRSRRRDDAGCGSSCRSTFIDDDCHLVRHGGYLERRVGKGCERAGARPNPSRAVRTSPPPLNEKRGKESVTL